MTKQDIKQLAHACGFELAGITAALPSDHFDRFEQWRTAGFAGEMSYMTDRRGDLRSDPRNLLPAAQSVVCVGKLYAKGQFTSEESDRRGRISCYARGPDYHDYMRRDLEELVRRIREQYCGPFEYRICVDTAPLLERSYARAAGLGWIGKNTCLINQEHGSWLFLAELLLSIPLAVDGPAPFRCGTCTRCIDACPTHALVPSGDGGWMLDSRLCISYLTIEKRGEVDPELARRTGNHVFGCDICQEVCPWNAQQGSGALAPGAFFGTDAIDTDLERLAGLSEQEFREVFRKSPVWRSRYQGFLRNVAFALGNSHDPNAREPLLKLAAHTDPVVARSAAAAISNLDSA